MHRFAHPLVLPCGRPRSSLCFYFFWFCVMFFSLSFSLSLSLHSSPSLCYSRSRSSRKRRVIGVRLNLRRFYLGVHRPSCRPTSLESAPAPAASQIVGTVALCPGSPRSLRRGGGAPVQSGQTPCSVHPPINLKLNPEELPGVALHVFDYPCVTIFCFIHGCSLHLTLVTVR